MNVILVKAVSIMMGAASPLPSAIVPTAIVPSIIKSMQQCGVGIGPGLATIKKDCSAYEINDRKVPGMGIKKKPRSEAKLIRDVMQPRGKESFRELPFESDRCTGSNGGKDITYNERCNLN